MTAPAQAIAVVIPALNEEKAIGPTVASVLQTLGVRAARVLVVDDGSSDATASVATDAGAIVIQHPENRGYDAALQTGFDLAAQLDPPADILISFDADGQHNPVDLPSLLARFDEPSVALVVGRRPTAARWAERAWRLYGRLHHGIDDPLCGAKALRSALYPRFSGAMAVPSVFTALAFDMARAGLRIENHPITIRPRGDDSRFGGGLGTNLRILSALSRMIWRDVAPPTLEVP